MKRSNLLFGIFFLIFFTISLIVFASADPTGPVSMTILTNETNNASSTSPGFVNVSGGIISTINITAKLQNSRWKGMVGYMSGKFALSDLSGSTLFDWETVLTTGRVYATHNSSTVTWSQIKCANTTILHAENIKMNHTRSDDNVTATFSSTAHSTFKVGDVQIPIDTCPSLHTYVNNASQGGEFSEVTLYDGATVASGGNVIYTALLNSSKIGFDGQNYDFQMIVPEFGAATWTGSTAYYLYVELS